MQDVQNIPNPDVNSTIRDDGFGSHSDTEEIPEGTDTENIPLPADKPKPAPIEEPPNPEDAEIKEDNNEPQRIV